jgi:methionyl-tRNA synthetase
MSKIDSKEKNVKDQKLKTTTKRKWVVTSAWPYVNATPHLGNMIGSVLSADVFARYLRLKGDEVVFVSGSDEHGTPIAVEAIKQGIEPEALANKKHAEIVKIFKDWNISYDNYTHTHTPTHIKFTQEFYLQVQKNGYISEKRNDAYFCPEDKFFLPDRFIEGTCPYCNKPGARGDQCDNPACGKVLEPEQLIDPHCKICLIKPEHKLTVPIKKSTKHWYLEFPKVQDQIVKFIDDNKIIPQNARSMCLNSCEKGLPERAITRDLKWGIPAPFKDSEGKSIYVWFEAVLGYISAVKEWANDIKKKPELFSHFWHDPNTRTVYFIGKDNILFHLMVFPGLLFGYNANLKESEQFILPYNVSSTEFLMYENDKFSKSRGIGIWTDEALKLAPVDYWRYSLIRNRPEGRDVSFIWAEFENNVSELNDKIGNFVHRVFTFIFTKFDGLVPAQLELDADDKKIIELIGNAPKEVGTLIEDFRLRDAIGRIMEIAHEGNVYLNAKEPWKLIKTNKSAAGHVFNICAQLSRTLGMLLSPFLPNSSEKILRTIGCKECRDNELVWDTAGEQIIEAGASISKPEPVFTKYSYKDLLKQLREIRAAKGEKFELPTGITEADLEQDNIKKPAPQIKEPQVKKNDQDTTKPIIQEKMEQESKQTNQGNIPYDFFQKFHLKTGRINAVEAVKKGKGNRFIISIQDSENSSIKSEVELGSTLEELKQLIGKDLVYVENLDITADPNAAKVNRDILLTVEYENKKHLILIDNQVPPGSNIH